MRGPRLWLGLAAAGGAAAAAGSLLTWATVRIDLSAVFELFPEDYAQALGGLELGGTVTLVAASIGLLAAVAAGVDGRLRIPAGAVILAAAAAALMWALYHVVRMRPLALAALERASGRPAESFEAAVSAGPGPFVVIAGAVLALAGGVMIAAGRATPGRHEPGAAAGSAEPVPPPG